METFKAMSLHRCHIVLSRSDSEINFETIVLMYANSNVNINVQ